MITATFTEFILLWGKLFPFNENGGKQKKSGL